MELNPLESRCLLTVASAPALITQSALVSGYSVDGTNNNLAFPTWGAANTDLIRIAPAAYADGLSTPSGPSRPNARQISYSIFDQGTTYPVDNRGLSAMFYAWGQFIDHDLSLTPSATASQPFNIVVPTGDPWFDPKGTGTQTISLNRSAADPLSGATTPREQVNTISTWLDGSMIYGSDLGRANALRTFQNGMLKTSAGNLLPLDNIQTFPGGTLSMANDAQSVPESELFAAGDVRANENIELTTLQTLFLREHNFWAQEIAGKNPGMSDEWIYQQARSVVIAEIQSITYNQWLPALLGTHAMAPYAGYQPKVNPSISNEFSTAAFRFGHSLLGNDVEFLNNNGLSIRDSVSLNQAFSNPGLVEQNGIEPLLKYLASDPASSLDTKVVDSLRNMLFGMPGQGGLDLVSLNIQRGRDHGLADYNTVRHAYGLPRVTSFAQITSDSGLQARLKHVYGSVNNLDLWVAGLAETHAPGSSIGPTFRAIIANQFTRLRDGDRFWYQRAFKGSMLSEIENTTLTDILRRDTNLTNLQANPFYFRAAISGTVRTLSHCKASNDTCGPGVPHQTVQLFDLTTQTVAATKRTDGHGQYAFAVKDGLRTGRYQVRVVTHAGSTQVIHSSRVLNVRQGQQSLEGNIFIPSR